MLIPLSYNMRSVLARWRNTGATILTIGLAVAVIIVMFALQGGIKKSLASTGTPGNVLIMRGGSTAELNSIVSIANLHIIMDMPGIQRTPEGRPMVSPEVVQVQAIPRAGSDVEVNVSVRGIGPMGRELRPVVRLVEGRWYKPGLKEATIPQRLSQRFGRGIGDTIRLGRSSYTIVGITEAGRTAYDSEVWSDVDSIREDYLFENFSVIMARVQRDYGGPMPVAAADADPAKAQQTEEKMAELRASLPSRLQRGAEALARGIDADRRLAHAVRTEASYFESQQVSAKPLEVLGMLLGFLMGPGAALAAMNAMYATIASRTREIGTLRVLGFRRPAVLVAFLVESVALGVLGGAAGCAMSYALIDIATRFDMANFGTLNFVSFSELVFQFQIERGFLVAGMVFSAVIGAVGGLLPAWAAARLPVLVALKSR
jgi:ABC-type antimicrobial peptide transport system permease subunit